MTSAATTVEEYLDELPEDRRVAITAVRNVILENLPKGYEEGMGYGMISYCVPHSIYPKGYHCNPKQALPFVSLASQKNYMTLYAFCLYVEPGAQEQVLKDFEKAGKKLTMGKGCIKFKKVDELDLPAIGVMIARTTVDRFIQVYETNVLASKKK
jgi:hypothetical protein